MRKLCAVLGMLAGLSLPGQEFRATLTGRVTDRSGAAVAGAAVGLKNTATNEASRTETDAQGSFTFALLRPGSYELTSEHEGFRKLIRKGVSLEVGQAASIDLVLDLGEVSQSITVTDEAPLLDNASADRGGVISAKEISEFPLNGRNPFMLSMLVAGVDYNGSMAYQRPFDNGAIADFGISGGANRSNEFLMDGVPNNAQAGGNNIAYVPPVDSVQEFKIQTNSYDAQYGKTSGGIVNVVLKSGSNRMHGSLYEYARRNAWDANSFQNNARGAPKEGHTLDQYGAQADGPVIKNKLFFLFNYEGYRENSPQPLVLSVPEMDMRQGDFSKLADARGRGITIHDPATGFVNPAFANRWDRLPFPGNVIPKDRIHPMSSTILNFMPKPNTLTPNQDYSRSNLFLSGGDNPAFDTFYNLVFKFDWSVGPRHRMFFRHASNDRTEERNTNGVRTGPGQDGQHPLKRINDAYVMDWVATITPTLLFNWRSSFARYVEGSSGEGNRDYDLEKIGFPKSLTSQLPYGAWFGRYTFTDYISLGRYPSRNFTNTVTTHPVVTWVKGSRTLKAGLDMRFTQYATNNPGNVFTLGGSKTFTQRDFQRADAFSGNAIASWLMGTPSSGTVNYNVYPIYMFPYMAPWFQGDWKLTRKLTVNAGLRWDFNRPPQERFLRMNRGFDADYSSPLNALIDRARFPELPELKGRLLFAGVDGVPARAANLYKWAVQPRIGVAYALNSKTVLRGGYGRFAVNPNNDYLQTNGFSISTPLVFSVNENREPLNNKIEDPFAQGILKPPGASEGATSFVGRGFSFVNSDFIIPSVSQFSFGVQRALWSRSRLEITYSGSRGNRLQNSKVFNDAEVSFRDRCNFMLGGNPAYCDQNLPNPFRGLEAFQDTTYYTATNVSRGQLLRPFPQFTGLTELMRNDGRNWYNSLQTTYTVRAKRVTLTGNYTFAKNVEQNGFLDPLNNVMQRGLVAFDKPHRFVVSSITQLPFGRKSHGWQKMLLAGWEHTTIFQLASGRPWDLPSNVQYLKDARIPLDWSGARVQAVAPCVQRWNENNTITYLQHATDYGCKEANWLVVPRFNPRYTPFRASNIRLQGVRMLDMSLNKTTAINERYRVQFRAEVFNVTNSFRVIGAVFNNNAENVNFGSIEKAAVSAPQSNYPRQVQLAVKFIW